MMIAPAIAIAASIVQNDDGLILSKKLPTQPISVWPMNGERRSRPA